MTKVVSDDSAHRALHKLEEKPAKGWLQQHLLESYRPLSTTPWI